MRRANGAANNCFPTNKKKNKDWVLKKCTQKKKYYFPHALPLSSFAAFPSLSREELQSKWCHNKQPMSFSKWNIHVEWRRYIFWWKKTYTFCNFSKETQSCEQGVDVTMSQRLQRFSRMVMGQDVSQLILLTNELFRWLVDHLSEYKKCHQET